MIAGWVVRDLRHADGYRRLAWAESNVFGVLPDAAAPYLIAGAVALTFQLAAQGAGVSLELVNDRRIA